MKLLLPKLVTSLQILIGFISLIGLPRWHIIHKVGLRYDDHPVEYGDQKEQEASEVEGPTNSDTIF